MNDQVITIIITAITTLFGSSVVSAIVVGIMERQKRRAETQKTSVQTDDISVQTARQMVAEQRLEIDRLRAILDEDEKEREILKKALEKERQEREELARRVQALENDPIFKAVIAIVSEPIFILDASDGKILDVNDNACIEYGYSQAELLNLTILDLSAEPEKSLQTLQKRIINVPCRMHKRKDGSTFPISATLSYFTRNNRQCAIVSIRFLNSQENMDSLRSRINRYLDVVRSEFGADWSILWDFHNGDYDENGVPVMKISSIGEACGNQVKPITGQYKDMPTILFYDNTLGLIKEPVIVANANSLVYDNMIKREMMKGEVATIYMSGVSDVDGHLVGILSIAYAQETVLDPKKLDRFTVMAATADYFVVKNQMIARKQACAK